MSQVVLKLAIKLLNGPLGFIFKKVYDLYVKWTIDRIKVNVFKKKYSKRVLISYTTTPFTIGILELHTNFLECYTAASIFDELGYQVDVVDFRSGLKHNYQAYELIYGFGTSFENVFYDKRVNIDHIITICYSPGANPMYSDEKGLEKLYEVYRKTGQLFAQSMRFSVESYLLQKTFSDTIVALGNHVTENTYDSRFRSVIRSLPPFFYKKHSPNFARKDLNRARKHFLWFGSLGAIHKGLDVLIEVFRENIDYCLHICGSVNLEVAFYEYYLSKPSPPGNIYIHGFVEVSSESFVSIMEQCLWCILPSLSEGGAPSVATVVGNGGLIPIISSMSGLTFGGNEILLADNTPQTISHTIRNLVKLPDAEIATLAQGAYKYANENYTPENYKHNLKELILEAIERKHHTK